LLNVSTPIGSIGVTGGDWLARAYLPPTIQTVQLRRGRVMSVVNRTWPSVPEPAKWMLAEPRLAESWAQIVVAGRRFEDVLDEADQNRPFSVTGQFTDEELVGIVQFIRSRPVLPRLPWATSAAGKVAPVYGPIMSVVRNDGGIWVHMRRGASAACNRDGSDIVSVEYRDSNWTGAFAGGCVEF
jgi:hypothetical protein